MDKSNILLRLEMLADLCETTEPDVPSDKQLFSNHLIEVQNMITLVTNIESGSLAGYWNFQNSFNDASGNSNHGTNTGATFTGI